VCLVLKTTTILLTDIIAVLSWPKNWIIENVCPHLAFFFFSYLYALVAPTFQAKQFTLWLGRHLKTPEDLAAEIFLNVTTGTG
jgi:hypothetical protein